MSGLCCEAADERTRGDENAVEVEQDHRAGNNMVSVARKFLEVMVIHILSSYTKGKPPNCCNSSAARRVSENADPICKQSNRETS